MTIRVWPGRVPAFVQTLVDRSTHDATYPFVNEESAGDIDGSGVFDLGDIGPFSGLFGGPASARHSEVNYALDLTHAACV